MARNKQLLIGIGIGIVLLFILLFIAFLLIWPGSMNLIPAKETIFPTEKSKYIIGQTFSKEDADRFINISSNDYIVKESKLEPGNDSDVHISCVTAEKYLECAPGGIPSDLLNPPVYRVLPVVRYYIGDPAYDGMNVSVFIDPDKEYVPYIGYTVRHGKESNFTYTTTANGVDISNKDPNPPAGSTILEYCDNISIGYTNYIPPEKLTQDQKDEMTGIILNNSYITNSLKGYDYEISGVHSQSIVEYSGAGYYLAAYPSVYIINRNTSKPIMEVEVDLSGKKVASLRRYPA